MQTQSKRIPSVGDLTACAARHLADYIDPQSMFGFNTYDYIGSPGTLEPLDCFAPNLLSLRLGYEAIVPLFQPAGPAAELLAAMRRVLTDKECTGANFLECDLQDESGPWSVVDAAFAACCSTRGIRAVAVSKILHRKRPQLVPIFDRQVFRFYFGSLPRIGACLDAPRRLWVVQQVDLGAHRAWLSSLVDGHETPDGQPISLLRAADIVVWMHQRACAMG